MKHRILLLEDSREDAQLYRALLVDGTPPFLYNVELIVLPKPFEDPMTYRGFAGIILDHNIGFVSGIQEARRIKSVLPEKPLMLMSGAVPYMTQEDRNLFTSIADKNELEEVWGASRELLRFIEGKSTGESNAPV